ncbi:YybH family protein [Spongiimicrobium salis]|uniref:YybH family protein n=1 Tax=Spongiimicrobium salis TaxID=1667022 RepID=UPI00374D1433
MRKVIFIALTGLFIISCANNEKAVPTAAEIAKLNQKEVASLIEASRNWGKAANPEEFFSYIGEDALMLAPDKGVIKGHKDIGKVLQEFQSLPGFKITWEPQEAFVSNSGDLGYSRERILVNFDGEDGKQVNLFEKGISIWKKNEKGEWQMAVDIWNIDQTITSIYK